MLLHPMGDVAVIWRMQLQCEGMQLQYEGMQLSVRGWSSV